MTSSLWSGTDSDLSRQSEALQDHNDLQIVVSR